MKGLNTLYGSSLWYFLCLTCLALVIAAISVLIRMGLEKRSGRARLFSFAVSFMAFLLFVLLMDAGHAAVNHEGRYLPMERALFALPWLIYAFVELILGGLLLYMELDHLHYRKNYLTSNAIHRTVNFLPDGIAISDDGGTVRLSNLKMDNLCREITGEVLTDTKRFIKRLAELRMDQSEQLLVVSKDGSVWLFENEPMILDEKEYRQLTARDVTERVHIIEELKEKNEHLREIQLRMRAVSELSGDMFVTEEQAKARAALHNQLGQVLLMGKHYLGHPGSTDPKLVYLATRQMNLFLLGETEQPGDVQTDAVSEAITAANSIGVRIEIKGNTPREEYIRAIIAQALAECAANTVKHAEGDALYAELMDNGKSIFLSITNNGKPPKGEIAESGGLLSLRCRVEDAGGSMYLESDPVFVLILKIPRETNSEQSQIYWENGTNG